MLSPAILTLITNLTDKLQKQLPELETRLRAEGYQAGGLGELLAKVQWQVVGLVQGLYACLAGPALSSPPRRSLDVKVRSPTAWLCLWLQWHYRQEFRN